MMTGGTVPLFCEPPNLGNLDENLTVEPWLVGQRSSSSRTAHSAYAAARHSIIPGLKGDAMNFSTRKSTIFKMSFLGFFYRFSTSMLVSPRVCVYICLYHISSCYIPLYIVRLLLMFATKLNRGAPKKMTNDRAVQAQATRSLGQENHEEDHLGIFPPESL